MAHIKDGFKDYSNIGGFLEVRYLSLMLKALYVFLFVIAVPAFILLDVG